VVDAHLHVWDLSVCSYPWLGPEHGQLFATYAPEQAAEALASCGIERAVLVQAENSTEETGYLLAVAAEHTWVAGVVGWFPLEDPRATAASLERFAAQPRLCGARHLVHDDPRPDFLDLPSVRSSLRLLGRAGLPFDVPDAWPRHLRQAGRLAEDLPDLVLVIDHLAKPPLGRDDLDDWRAELARVARSPHTVAKLSGLRMPGVPYTVDALRPAWDAALELFGPSRLMFGSDWPMTVPEGGYRPTYDVLAALVAELSTAEQRDVVAGTAERVYGLDQAI
jgi:L-fuconolactonase